MSIDMVALARMNEGAAVILYDQFREVGNVLSGYICAYEDRTLEKGDRESAAIFNQEYIDLRETINATRPDDIDEQARLMDEWRGIVRGLRAA